jgi:hypothetical protein
MTFVDSRLVGLVPASMPGRQHAIMIIEWGQPETEFEPAPARIFWSVGMLGSRFPLSIFAISDWATPARSANSLCKRPASRRVAWRSALAVVGGTLPMPL